MADKQLTPGTCISRFSEELHKRCSKGFFGHVRVDVLIKDGKPAVLHLDTPQTFTSDDEFDGK